MGLRRAIDGQAFTNGRIHKIHQLEKSFQDFERLKSFFIPAYYMKTDRRETTVADLVPNSTWTELEIKKYSKVKSIFSRIEIFSTSSYATQLKWCPIFLKERDVGYFPQELIDGLETNYTLNNLQDDELTRWLIPRQKQMTFQPRQAKTLIKHFRPTRGRAIEIRSPCLAGVLLQNASVKEGSFDFKITTAFSEYQLPENYEEQQFGSDAVENVGS